MAGVSGYGVGTKAGGGDMVEVDGGDFNYNDKIMVETSQVKCHDFEIRPIGAITNSRPKGPQYFCIDPFVDKYLVNNRTRLEARLRVVKGNGEGISPLTDVVAPNNLIGPLMWESVVVHLNGQPFPGASNVNAGLKCYMDTMLSTENDARHTHMQTQVFHMDTPKNYEEMGMDASDFYDACIYELERGSIFPLPTGLVEARSTLTPGNQDFTPEQKAAAYAFPHNGREAVNGYIYVPFKDARTWIMAEARAAGDPTNPDDTKLFR